MVITGYQVQSVLRTYTRQLKKSKLLAKEGRDSSTSDSGEAKISISDESKRKLIMDRLTSRILDNMCPKQDDEAGPAGRVSANSDGPVAEGNQ
ncbi:MAG: hypothetical protein M1398_04700 [Deltaproteobacteria bacterium]|jgi:hypothetical protein|nr:hypothetical protein [Deltaproteobacteria bacterium]MDA8306561.1 hypothetical protein [Deltaproteobacteria bacterium]